MTLVELSKTRESDGCDICCINALSPSCFDIRRSIATGDNILMHLKPNPILRSQCSWQKRLVSFSPWPGVSRNVAERTGPSPPLISAIATKAYSPNHIRLDQSTDARLVAYMYFIHL
jgi:hypothetical protein